MNMVIKDIPRQRLIAWLILISLFLYSCVILAISTGTFDTGDGVMHYLISRYSWHYPAFFLDDWGKPLFTLVSSPFSQLGLKGIIFFNILCGLTASYLAYKIAEKIGIPFPYLAMVFTFSAPIYFSVVNSGLTEPMFSMMLMLCIWLIISDRVYLSAIVFSFLPFIRAEYVFVAPVFLLYYILKRKYKAILLLPTGTIIVSLVGSFYYKSLLWLIAQNPYSAANSTVYGNVHGTMLSYIGHYSEITGIALAILIILGLIWLATNRFLKRETSSGNYFKEEFILVFGCFASILICHTVVWAAGIFPTLGLLRYMSPLIPMAAILALRGLQLINQLPVLFNSNRLKALIAICFGCAVIYSPYMVWFKPPYNPDPPNLAIARATDWLKQSGIKAEKYYYSAPYISVCLDLDHFNKNVHTDANFSDPKHPGKEIPSGSIFIYDNQYCANGGTDTTSLLQDLDMTLLKKFSGTNEPNIYDGQNAPVWVLQRK